MKYAFIVEHRLLFSINAILSTNLAANITNPQLNVAPQHFIAILRRPDEVVVVVKNGMFTRRIFIIVVLPKNAQPRN